SRTNCVPTSLRRDLLVLPHPLRPPLPVFHRRAKIQRTALRRYKARVDKEQKMGKGSAEEGTVDGAVAGGFGRVEVFATPAIKLYGFFVSNICQAHREERLELAEYTRASTEVGTLAAGGDDPPGVDETVEKTGLDVERASYEDRVLTKIVCNEVKSLRIVGYFIVKTGQIEAIEDKVFVDFTKIFVAFGRQKPRNPLYHLLSDDSKTTQEALTELEKWSDLGERKELIIRRTWNNQNQTLKLLLPL
ncbi:hypothetical protein C0993_005176, partial [Termitomyces sp. T159_Od127]